MAVQIASQYNGTMDEYLAQITYSAEGARLMKTYAAESKAKVLGVPPMSQEEINKRIREEKKLLREREEKLSARTKMARFLEKVMKARQVVCSVACTSAAFAAPFATAACIGYIHLETKLVNGFLKNVVANQKDAAALQRIKEAEERLKALKIAKKIAKRANAPEERRKRIEAKKEQRFQKAYDKKYKKNPLLARKMLKDREKR